MLWSVNMMRENKQKINKQTNEWISTCTFTKKLLIDLESPKKECFFYHGHRVDGVDRNRLHVLKIKSKEKRNFKLEKLNKKINIMILKSRPNVKMFKVHIIFSTIKRFMRHY